MHLGHVPNGLAFDESQRMPLLNTVRAELGARQGPICRYDCPVSPLFDVDSCSLPTYVVFSIAMVLLPVHNSQTHKPCLVDHPRRYTFAQRRKTLLRLRWRALAFVDANVPLSVWGVRAIDRSPRAW